jgi:hypothetical protein
MVCGWEWNGSQARGWRCCQQARHIVKLRRLARTAAQPGWLIDFGNRPELPNSVPSFLTVFGGVENPS